MTRSGATVSRRLRLRELLVGVDVVDGIGPGRALDAACGTGRHAGHLVELGHGVLVWDVDKA